MIKKFSILLIFFILIMYLFNTFSFAADVNTFYGDLSNYKVDSISYLLNWQENLQASAFNVLLRKIGDTPVSELTGSLSDLVRYLTNTSYYPYVVYQNNFFYVWFYTTNSFSNVYDTPFEGTLDISYNNTNFVKVPTVLHGFQRTATFRFGSFGSVSSEQASTHIPDCLMFFISDSLTNFRDSLNKNDIGAINEAIEKNNELQEQTNKTLQDTKDFITEDLNGDEIDSSLPSFDSDIDPTTSGVNEIFNLFKNGINNNNSFSFNLLGTDFVISSDLLSSHLPSSLVVLINAFWWFFICRFILKDVISIIEKISVGDIDKVDTTNVKASMF